jgi:hypothetical protein
MTNDFAAGAALMTHLRRMMQSRLSFVMRRQARH